MTRLLKKTCLAVLRLAIGVAIVLYLIHNINTTTLLATFQTSPVTVTKGAVYQDDAAAVRCIVADSVENSTLVQAICPADAKIKFESLHALKRAGGEGPDLLTWKEIAFRPIGLQLIGQSFATAFRNWGPLAASVFMFLICMLLCIVRWSLILDVQGLKLPLSKVSVIFFIGHFFNAFLFGATGGDIVKAYYVAKETGHKKAEAVSTVFIDRIIGLFGLLILTSFTMAARLDFFLSHAATKYALLALGIVLVLTVIMLLVMIVLRRRHSAEPVSVEQPAQSGVKGTIFRVYRAASLCLTHPALLFKTILLSMLNHIALVVMMFFIGKALLIHLGMLDYISVGPTIVAIGTIPITPGGLGLREYAAVTYLGLLGVSAAKALPFSLLVYTNMLIWSLVGGLVFLTHSSDARLDSLEEATGQEG